MLPINGYRLAALGCLLCGFHASMLGSELCVNVVDETDLSLPNAWVTITRMIETPTNEAGEVYTRMTDSKGKLCVSIPEGVYSVEVGLIGFLSVRYQPVRVTHPYESNLNYRLPAGDVTEGGVEVDGILTGILASGGKPIEGAKICVLKQADAAIVTCGRTNVFGEYALSVPPGTYRTETTTAAGEVYHSTVSAPRPGYYRNAVSLGEKISRR